MGIWWTLVQDDKLCNSKNVSTNILKQQQQKREQSQAFFNHLSPLVSVCWIRLRGGTVSPSHALEIILFLESLKGKWALFIKMLKSNQIIYKGCAYLIHGYILRLQMTFKWFIFHFSELYGSYVKSPKQKIQLSISNKYW